MQYVANLVVEADDPILAEIDKFWEANKPKGFKKDPKSTGVYDHTCDSGKKDDEGKTIYKPSGKKYLAFKTGTTFPDGSTKTVAVYNSKNQKVVLPEGTQIGNGSIGRVAGAMGIYTNQTKQGVVLEAGVTLYLDGIKLLKLVEFSSGPEFDDDDSDFEGGYEGPTTGFEGTDETDEVAATHAAPRLQYKLKILYQIYTK